MPSYPPRSLRRLAVCLSLAGVAIGASTVGLSTASAAAMPPFTWFAESAVNLANGQIDTSGWEWNRSGSVSPDGSAYALLNMGGANGSNGIFGSNTMPLPTGFKVTYAKANPDGTWAWLVAPTIFNSGGVSAAKDNGLFISANATAGDSFGSTSLPAGGFLGKVTGSGSLAWASYATSGSPGYVNDAGATADGGAMIATAHTNANPLVFGSSTLPGTPNDLAVLAKANADGSWAWALQASGRSSYGNSVQAYPDGTGLLAGYMDTTSGPAVFGSTSLTATTPNNQAAFFARGGQGGWQWATSANYTRSGWDIFAIDRKVTLAPDGSAYVTDGFTGTATFGSISLTSVTSSDIFVAKLNPDGTWAWATRVGNAAGNNVRSIGTVSESCNTTAGAVITGNFDNSITFGGTTLTSAAPGDTDGFAAQISSGGEWQWATRLSGSGSGSYDAVDIAVSNPQGGVAILGRSSSTPYTFGSRTVNGTIGFWTNLGGGCPAPPSPPSDSAASPSGGGQSPAEVSPKITLPAASVQRGSSLTTVVNPSTAGTVTVSATLRGRTVCTVRKKATRAGRMIATCNLSPRAKAAIRKRAVTLTVTSRLTDATGRTATASRNVRVARYVVRTPVTG